MNRWIPNPFRRSEPPPLACEEVGELLQQFLDDYVDDDLAGRIDAHLDDCRRCGLEAETYRRIKTSLASHRSEVPADSLRRLRVFGKRLAHTGEPTGQ